MVSDLCKSNSLPVVLKIVKLIQRWLYCVILLQHVFDDVVVIFVSRSIRRGLVGQFLTLLASMALLTPLTWTF